MSNEKAYRINSKELSEIIKTCMENRAVVEIDGEFWVMLGKGRKLKLKPEWIEKYIEAVMNYIVSSKFDGVNLISALYELDQEIVTTGWKEIDKNFSNKCIKFINSCKHALKEHQKYIPEDVEDMIIDVKKFRNRKASMYGYILQLFEEGIITQESLKNAGFFKDLTRDDLVRICLEGKISANLLTRLDSIARLNIAQIRQLGKLQFFDGLTYEELEQLRKNGLLNAKGVIELQRMDVIERDDAIQLLGGIDEIARTYRRFVENKNKNDAKLYFEVLNSNDVLTLYVNGKMTREDLDMVNISKNDVHNLSEGEFILLAKKGFPKGVSFTCEELLDGYLSQYSGKTLIELAKIGYVMPKKILDLTDIELDENNRERGVSCEDLLNFYTPKMVSDLLSEEVDIDFINKLDINLLSTLEKQERQEYLHQFIEECKDGMEEDKYTKTMIDLIEKSKLPRECFKQLEISEDVLMDMFLEGDISDSNVIQYFNEGIFGNKELETIYGDDFDAIINLVKQGTLDNRALAILPKQILAESLVLEELTAQDIFSVYAKHNGISVHDLRDIFDEYEDNTDQRVSITYLIDEEFDKDKIRELFIEDILTHSDVLELKEKGIITEEQSEEIAKINREKLYNEIFKNGITSEFDGKNDEEDERAIITDGGDLIYSKSPMMSAKKREEFFKSIAKCDFREVEGRDKNGREAPFKNYELIGYPEYGVVIFENFEKARNATYLMTLQELKSYVTNDDNGSIVFRRSKKALRKDINQGRAVRVCNHTPNWGHNVIEAMKELSKEAREKIDYSAQKSLADMMRKEFIKSRLEQDGGKDNPLIEMLINARVEAEKKKAEQAKVQEFEEEVSEVFEEESTKEAEGEEHGEQ